VGLAVDRSHGRAEFAQCRLIDQLHRNRESDAEGHREQRSEIAPRVMAQFGTGEVGQEREHVSWSTQHKPARPEVSKGRPGVSKDRTRKTPFGLSLSK